jgi:hypothetical protein
VVGDLVEPKVKMLADSGAGSEERLVAGEVRVETFGNNLVARLHLHPRGLRAPTVGYQRHIFLFNGELF